MLPALARLVQFAFPIELKETREREREGGREREREREREMRNVILLAPYRRDTKTERFNSRREIREMLLRTSGILTSRKKKVDVCHERYCSSWIMCVKGFFYRFMYVCVREKMAGKVNRYLLMDYQTGIS